MPTGRFKYEKLAKYPHMKPEDIFTWEKYIDENPEQYTSVDYDYALGEVAEHKEQAMQLGISGAEKTYQYKADVIGYAKGSVDIIELKGKATPSTIGQVQSYKNIYDREAKPVQPTRAVIIASSISLDLERLCKEAGIILIVV